MVSNVIYHWYLTDKQCCGNGVPTGTNEEMGRAETTAEVQGHTSELKTVLD